MWSTTLGRPFPEAVQAAEPWRLPDDMRRQTHSGENILGLFCAEESMPIAMQRVVVSVHPHEAEVMGHHADAPTGARTARDGVPR